ncbi:MAG: hypothetical protein ABJM43_10925 [Paracoccaceae bacterium]
MTKFVAFSILFLLGFTNTLQAQTIDIKAGDHPTFTRLVFYVDESIAWNIEQKATEVLIGFENFTGTIDHSRVFDPISRSRISDIESNGGSITLKMNCVCRHRSSQVFSTYRYIDILPASGTYNEFLNISDSVILDARKNKLINVVEDDNELIDTALLPLYEDHLNLDYDLGRTSSQSRYDLPTAKPPYLPEPVFEISRSLGQIITHGTLKHSTDRSHPVLVIGDNFSTGNIEVKDPNSLVHQNEMSITNRSCGPFEKFSISEWKYSENFSHDAARFRGELFSEFDEVNIPTMESLAKMYIYHSFGAEARQILNRLVDSSFSYSILVELSELVDGNFDVAAATIFTMYNCSDFFVLLNFLLESDVPAFNEFDVNRALLALNSLPLHLRQIFAPRLSSVLLTAGDTSSARLAIKSVERGHPDNLNEVSFANTMIELNSNNDDAAIAKLRKISIEDSRQSLRSAIELSASVADQGGVVPEEILDLLTAYAVEYRDTEIEPEILKSIILALSSAGNHHQAFDSLDFFLDKFGNSYEIGEIFDRLFEDLNTNPDKASFVSSIFRIFPNSNITTDGYMLNSLSTRMTEYGFGDSLKYLWPPSPSASSSSLDEDFLVDKDPSKVEKIGSLDSEAVPNDGRSDDLGDESFDLQPSFKPADDTDRFESSPTIKTANELLSSSQTVRKNISDSLF